MPAIPRKLLPGCLVRCSKCRHLRPLSWFTKDRHAPLGIGYQCRACRPKSNKVETGDPDFSVIPTSSVKPAPYSAIRMTAGSWERVLARAGICTPQETVAVNVGRSYYAHNSAQSGILEAARRLKMKVRVRHGINEVYVSVS